MASSNTVNETAGVSGHLSASKPNESDRLLIDPRKPLLSPNSKRDGGKEPGSAVGMR